MRTKRTRERDTSSLRRSESLHLQKKTLHSFFFMRWFNTDKRDSEIQFNNFITLFVSTKAHNYLMHLNSKETQKSIQVGKNKPLSRWQHYGRCSLLWSRGTSYWLASPLWRTHSVVDLPCSSSAGIWGSSINLPKIKKSSKKWWFWTLRSLVSLRPESWERKGKMKKTLYL